MHLILDSKHEFIVDTSICLSFPSLLIEYVNIIMVSSCLLCLFGILSSLPFFLAFLYQTSHNTIYYGKSGYIWNLDLTLPGYLSWTYTPTDQWCWLLHDLHTFIYLSLDYIEKYATEQALWQQEHRESSSESEMSDLSDEEMQNMEL